MPVGVLDSMIHSSQAGAGAECMVQDGVAASVGAEVLAGAVASVGAVECTVQAGVAASVGAEDFTAKVGAAFMVLAGVEVSITNLGAMVDSIITIMPIIEEIEILVLTTIGAHLQAMVYVAIEILLIYEVVIM